MKDRINSQFFRSTIFGFEDGLVSTTGVVVGIAAGSGNQEVVVLAGAVTIFVEALSMGAGQFISDKAVSELEGSKDHKRDTLSGILMFVSYFLAGLVPVLPFVFFPVHVAIAMAVLGALAGLFTLGFIKGAVLGIRKVRSGLEILLLGGIASAVGLAIGSIFGVS